MQTIVMEGRLKYRTRPDHQVHRPGNPAAVLVGTPALVARAGTGDRVALDQLVDRYGAMVWTVARALASVNRTRPMSARSRG